MPRQTPTLSHTLIRNYAEKHTWQNPTTGETITGFNPPEGVFSQRVPFYFRALTKRGELIEGNAVCISVDTKRLQRKVKFTQSNEIRIIHDLLVIEIDGIKFLAH